jgi:carbamoyl-phosphate synthase large subunit
MRLKPINIMVTGAGAPGFQGTVYSLKENYDNREVTIIGTDIKDSVAGSYLSDIFFTIPAAKEKDIYLDRILDICNKCKIDVFVPQNTMELLTLSQNLDLFDSIGTKVLVSDYTSMVAANDKHHLFNVARSIGVPTSRFDVCSTFDKFVELVETFKTKNGMVVVKPPLSNGSRGVRIITEKRDRKHDFYNEKPTSLYTTKEELHDILGEEFPELLVMEYLPGVEYTVDVFRTIDKFCAIPRKREVIRSGITFTASLEKNEDMIKYSRLLAEACNLTFCFGFQFKMNEKGEPVLLECNPRVQGTMVMSTFCGANIIYSSVKSLLGEGFPDFKINWGTKLYRYWGALGVDGENVIKI